MKTYVIDEETLNQIKSALEALGDAVSVPESYKFAELKEAYANGAAIQFFSKLTAKWVTPDAPPAWDENTEYRIDPTWVAEQGSKLYAWDVYNRLDKYWFRATCYSTKAEIENEYPTKNYRHVRGAEFCPPKDEK